MAEPLRDEDPSQVGPYRLLERLGGGGMGQVFLGRSRGGRLVAVKVVRPELAEDNDFLRRFADEVAAARKVGGFYTAHVVDADTEGDPPWMATAYIPGPSLYQAVRGHGPLPLESVAALGAGLAEGMVAVHAQGVVHRDLKPGNVILAEDGPRLIDFGIARALDVTSHTRSSTILGTAAFMSPEQARALTVGPPSDVFSFGCVLVFAATGRSPFGEGPGLSVLYRIVQEEPDLSGLPAPLVDLVTACLAKDPEARPDLDLVPAHLNTLVPVGDGPRERWLPEAVTEAITLRRTLVLETTTSERTQAFESQMRSMLHARFLAGVETLATRRLEPSAVSVGEPPPRPEPVRAEPAVPEPVRPKVPSPEPVHTGASLPDAVKPGSTGTSAEVFELTNTADRFARGSKHVLISLAPALTIYAVVFIAGLTQGHLDAVLHMPTEAVFGMILLFFLAMGTVGEVKNHHDVLVVDEGGLFVIDKRWLRARDHSFSLSWKDMARVETVFPGPGAGYEVVVTFKNGQNHKWAQRHFVESKTNHSGWIVAKLRLSLGNAEQAARPNRLRSALRRFGGGVYVDASGDT